MGNVIVMEPGFCYKVVPFDMERLTLSQIQVLVDGYICIALRVPSSASKEIWPGKRVMSDTIVFCDDAGQLKSLPPTWARPTDGHMLVGNIVWARSKRTWTEDGPDEDWMTLSINQEEAIVSWLKSEGWSELVLDEIDYTDDSLVMSGGKVGES